MDDFFPSNWRPWPTFENVRLECSEYLADTHWICWLVHISTVMSVLTDIELLMITIGYASTDSLCQISQFWSVGVALEGFRHYGCDARVAQELLRDERAKIDLRLEIGRVRLTAALFVGHILAMTTR